MSFRIEGSSGTRTVEIDTENGQNPDSVFIECGSFCIELPKGQFMDAILREVDEHAFYKIAWMAAHGPSYVRAA